jgi:RNA polymerase sigma-70 factor (ECF subfamily)
MALRYAGNSYDAEDMVQETLFIALKKINTLIDETKCKSWLFSVLRNVFLKELRIKGRKYKFEYDERDDYITALGGFADRGAVQEKLDKKVDKLQVQSILDKLPEKYKSPILLYFMEELTYQEISEYLDIPIGTVMSRLSRAKIFLKKEMLKVLKDDSSYGNVVELNKFKKAGDKL